MSRVIASLLGLVVTLGICGIATAHHPPKMERCESLSFTGELVRIEWRRPHVELVIRTDEGVTHTLSWLALNQLGLEGIEQDTLHIGDRFEVVAGIRPNDVVDRPLLLSYLHRESDGWGWSQTPQGC